VTRYTAPPPTDSRSVRRRVLLVGPVPPPFHGGSVVTKMLLDSPLRERFEFLHLDTTDRRGVENIGRLDFGNLRLAAEHGARFLGMLLRSRADLVCLPVAQNSLGFLRDALFLAPSVLRRVPLVLHFHNGAYREFLRSAPAPVRTLARALLGRAARAIVLGSTLRPMLDGAVAADRIVVVPNGVPDLTGGHRVDRGDGRMRILFLGNLIPAKGYIELLSAVRVLLGGGVDVEVTFAGSVVDRNAHQRALATVGAAADRIRFAGAVGTSEKTALLRWADVLALPTYYENEAHPLVVLEAMAAGLAVVSTRHAAIPETVVHQETGLLVEARDVDQLTGALRRLARDPALRERLGRAGRRRYLSTYTVETWAARMGAVFDSTEAAVA
jgi:glycosyltransferase involved in cell wall biosynthesis